MRVGLARHVRTPARMLMHTHAHMQMHTCTVAPVQPAHMQHTERPEAEPRPQPPPPPPSTARRKPAWCGTRVYARRPCMVGIAATISPAGRPHGTHWSLRPSLRSAHAPPTGRRRHRRRSTRRCTPPPPEPTHLAPRGWRRGGPEGRPPLSRVGWATSTSHRLRRPCTCSTEACAGF